MIVLSGAYEHFPLFWPLGDVGVSCLAQVRVERRVTMKIRDAKWLSKNSVIEESERAIQIIDETGVWLESRQHRFHCNPNRFMSNTVLPVNWSIYPSCLQRCGFVQNESVQIPILLRFTESHGLSSNDVTPRHKVIIDAGWDTYIRRTRYPKMTILALHAIKDI